MDFTLLADDNPAFSSPTVLGSFTANPNAGPTAAVLPQVFAFTPTEAAFVRMEITSNNGNPVGAGFGEAAFEVSTVSVPEPTSIALFGTSIAGLAAYGLRRRKQAV